MRGKAPLLYQVFLFHSTKPQNGIWGLNQLSLLLSRCFPFVALGITEANPDVVSSIFWDSVGSVGLSV